MRTDLPPELTMALDTLLTGASRKILAERHAALSAHYRAGGASSGVVTDEMDVLSYALARMPATYAALLTVFAELKTRCPNLLLQSLLDLGTGPGTALWAAREMWPHLAEMQGIDHGAVFLNLAQKLAGETVRAKWQNSALTPPSIASHRADLVTMSYTLAEIPEREREAVVTAAWDAAYQGLMIIEPGTPDGWQRILAARYALIAAKANIIAPCPHVKPCPLSAPDWCHFSVRLPRSRDHMLLKGGDVPYEDEKFIYLIAARQPAENLASARIIKPPRKTKPGLELPLCMDDGQARDVMVTKRDKENFARLRRADWGYAIEL